MVQGREELQTRREAIRKRMSEIKGLERAKSALGAGNLIGDLTTEHQGLLAELLSVALDDHASALTESAGAADRNASRLVVATWALVGATVGLVIATVGIIVATLQLTH